MSNSDNKQVNKKEKSSVFTKETLGVILILFSTLMLICLISRDSIFSLPGKMVNGFLFGLFGYFAYAVIIWLGYLGVLLVFNRKVAFSFKVKAVFTLMMILTAILVHAITMRDNTSLSYSDYISLSYTMADGGINTCSGGGFCTALITYFFTLIFENVGTYVITSLLIALFGYYLFNKAFKLKGKEKNKEDFKSSYKKEENEIPEISGVKDYPVDNLNFSEVNINSENSGKIGNQKLFVCDGAEFSTKSKREFKNPEYNEKIKINFTDGGLGIGTVNNTYSEKFDEQKKKDIEYIMTPPPIDIDKIVNGYKNTDINGETKISSPINSDDDIKEKDIPYYEHEESTKKEDSVERRAENFGNTYLFNDVNTENDQPQFDTKLESEQVYSFNEESNEGVTDLSDNDSSDIPFIEEEKEEEYKNDFNPKESSITSDRRIRSIFGEDKTDNIFNENVVNSDIAENNTVETEIKTSRRSIDMFEENVKEPEKDSFSFNGDTRNIEEKFEESEQEIFEEKEEMPIDYVYDKPPIDLLETYSQEVDEEAEHHSERQAIIKQTLEEFKINAEPESYIQGPSITRYEFMMPTGLGVSVKNIFGHDKDLQMRLASRNEIRVEAPIPGKNLIGVEVANNVPITVGLKEVIIQMDSENFKPNTLMFALGKDLVGKAKYDNLAKAPHYLVAGATGSGKSVCLNVMICSLIMRYSPADLRLILIDPKRVEFRKYEHIPHLMIDEIITAPKRVLAVLTWAYEEMERRYSEFEKHDGLVVDIESYNSTVANDVIPKMPRIVIIVDELADLMETCKRDLEAKIRALAQKARSAGIHLVLATQRPSVDIITGTIKANLPSRIAFKVMNYADSQTILSEQGAEKLLGNGDMLYKNSTMPSVERYQGAYISSREVNNVVNYIKENNKAYYDDELLKYLDNQTKDPIEEKSYDDDSPSVDNGEVDILYKKALSLAVTSGSISISQIQRRYAVGYPKAGRIIDKMERDGFISTNDGSKVRKVLLTREEYERRFGPIMPD